MVGQFVPKSGQGKERAIKIIEKALIEHALSEGYTLLNIHGARERLHTLSFTGSMHGKHLTGSAIHAKAR